MEEYTDSIEKQQLIHALLSTWFSQETEILEEDDWFTLREAIIQIAEACGVPTFQTILVQETISRQQNDGDLEFSDAEETDPVQVCREHSSSSFEDGTHHIKRSKVPDE